MAIQYGYNMPISQTPYGYQQAPLQYYAPAPLQYYAPAPVQAPQPVMGRNNYMIQAIILEN